MTVKWISHRGYKEHAVENTREAFQAALSCGFFALETDLRLSRDGHIVLHHDADLRRLADTEMLVSDLSREELSHLVLRERGRIGSLLFLDQFIREFPGCAWTFDIKPEKGEETVRALYEWAQSQGFYDLIVAQSKFVLWDEIQEQVLRALFPQVDCYAGERECWRAGLSALCGVPSLGGIKARRVYSLPPRLGPLSLFRPSLIKRFHERGACVLAFLPERDEEVALALEAGVDEILTNGLPVPGAASKSGL